MQFKHKLSYIALGGVSVMVVLLGMTSISLAQGDTWTFKTPMPTVRGFASGVVVDGKIYVIGGAPYNYSVTQANEMYDPATDTWTPMADMPAGRCAHATCTYHGKIYVFGGLSTSPYGSANKNVYEYDPQTNIWTQKADMPYANAICGIAVVKDTIYLIGGSLRNSSPPDSTVMAYNPVTESWTQKADMPTARSGLSACVVDGKIYAIGGTTENWQVFSYKLVEVYDPAADTWTRKSDMPTERWGLGTCVVDGKIYAIGGWAGSRGVCTTNEVYDPITDTWATKSPMQQKRNGAFVCSNGDKIYAIGGAYAVPQPTYLSSVEEYGIPSPTEANKAVIERWLKMWETADLAIADEIFATNFVSHIPHYPGAADLEGYKEEVARTPTSVPDFDATIEDMIADGDKVVGRFTASGTMQPYGVPYTNTWIIIFRFIGGKIVEEWWQFDLLGVQQQLGVITPGRPTPEDYTWGVPSAVTGDPGDPETNMAIALRDEELWNTGDLAIADEIFTTNFVKHDPGLPNVVDLEGYKAFIIVCFTSFPDFHTTVEDMVAEGDKVVTRRTVTATHQGEFAGIPPTGRQVTWAGMTIYRVADGKIVEAWWAYDGLGLMQQLTTAVEERSGATAAPSGYALSQNYPNPFNPQTSIKYELPHAGKVVLKVYNIVGEEICTLVDDVKPAGSFEVLWDGRDNTGQRVASGVYLYQLEVQEIVQTRKMLLLQ